MFDCFKDQERHTTNKLRRVFSHLGVIPEMDEDLPWDNDKQQLYLATKVLKNQGQVQSRPVPSPPGLSWELTYSPCQLQMIHTLPQVFRLVPSIWRLRNFSWSGMFLVDQPCSFRDSAFSVSSVLCSPAMALLDPPFLPLSNAKCPSPFVQFPSPILAAFAGLCPSVPLPLKTELSPGGAPFSPAQNALTALPLSLLC